MERLSQLLGISEPGNRRRYLIAALIAAILLGIWFSNFSSTKVDATSSVLTEVLSPSIFLVHIAGAVERPGLYEVSAGARVSDAVELAGGFSQGAIESSVNLARLVSDGEQVVVLHEDQLGVVGDYVSLNRASSSQLESLPGIGPSTAKKIIDHRSKIGSFSSVEQITDVPGIGSKLFEQIRDQLTL
jgi:competence protein ComEA